MEPDFRPANILLRLKDIDSLSEEELLTQLGESRKETLLTISGEAPGPSGPEYLVEPGNLEALDSRHFAEQACIIDFGESYDISKPPENLGIPLGYRSPELIFEEQCSVASDIWALACTIYELRSMRRLFENWDDEDDQVILQMVRLMGKLPEPRWSSWEARDRWFEEDGTPIVNPETGNTFAKPLTFEKLFAEGVHFTMSSTGEKFDVVVPPDEVQDLKDLLFRMLKYDPQARETVESVLDHPWFRESI